MSRRRIKLPKSAAPRPKMRRIRMAGHDLIVPAGMTDAQLRARLPSLLPSVLWWAPITEKRLKNIRLVAPPPASQ